MDYWDECISEAFEDAGIVASKEQRDTVASWACGAHENYGTTMGHDVMFVDTGPSKSELKQKIKYLEDELKQKDSHIDTFKHSVKMRRNCSDVWIENGEVRYNP